MPSFDSRSLKLEVACFNIEAARIAARAGADRIELCSGADVGGTTPDPTSAMKFLKDMKVSHPNLPIFVMIRPRGGNFVYDSSEKDLMRASLDHYKPAAAGFVFGALDDLGSVQLDFNRELVKLASPLPCTFHRAFDEAQDMNQALEDVIACGFSTILTSGGLQHAYTESGYKIIGNLRKKAVSRVEVMPGGGVRSSNLPVVMKHTEAKWYHSSAVTGKDYLPDSAEISKLQHILKVESGGLRESI